MVLIIPKSFKHDMIRIVFLLLLFNAVFISACATGSRKPFDPILCMETVPAHVSHMKILEGPRTRRSLIKDMVPVICHSQVVFMHMRTEDPALKGGRVVFRVVVEYTGEVNAVLVETTTLGSKRLLRSVSDNIMNHDFVGWTKDAADTVFLYPVEFGQ